MSCLHRHGSVPSHNTATDLALFMMAYSFTQKFSHQVVKFICISQMEVMFAIFKCMKPEIKVQPVNSDTCYNIIKENNMAHKNMLNQVHVK
jgi:hypothetical protein